MAYHGSLLLCLKLLSINLEAILAYWGLLYGGIDVKLLLGSAVYLLRT